MAMTRMRRMVVLLSAIPEHWPEPNAAWVSKNNDAGHVEFRKDGDDFLNVLCGIHNYAVGNNDGVVFFSDAQLPAVVQIIGDFLDSPPRPGEEQIKR